MKKKLISLLLAAALMLTLVPTVFAEESQTSYQQQMMDMAESYIGAKAEVFPDVSFDWCVYFVTYVAHELGLCGTPEEPASAIFPPIEKSTWGYCNYAATGISRQIQWFTLNDKGSLYYFDLGKSTAVEKNTVQADRYSFIPQPGDLVYFNTKEGGTFCHVAIVTDYDPGNGNVFYIGGNQDDRSWSKSHVSQRSDNLYTQKICGFMRPNYGTEYVYPQCSMGEACLSANFTDVTTRRWYHEDLDFVLDRGLFYGTSDTTFSPYKTMTRGMMVSVLYRLDGCPDTSEMELPFTDVTDETWCVDAIKWAKSTGVTDGYPDGTFGTKIEITRAQAAKMLFSYACYKGLDTSAYGEFEGFTDEYMIGEWMYDSLHWALGSGIISGTSATTVTPNGNATRCQLAAIFARYLRYYDI